MFLPSKKLHKARRRKRQKYNETTKLFIQRADLIKAQILGAPDEDSFSEKYIKDGGYSEEEEILGASAKWAIHPFGRMV